MDYQDFQRTLVEVNATLVNSQFKSESHIGAIAIEGYDTHTYLDPAENLIKRGAFGMSMGEFSPREDKQHPKFYPAIRTPYYSLFYLSFRLFFSESHACDLLAILQLIIEALSVLVLGEIVYRITKSKFAAGLAFICLMLSSWITYYSAEMMTESFTCSFLIFGFYYFQSWVLIRKNLQLFLSGLFIGYAVLMKPFLLPFMMFFPIALFFYLKNFRVFLKLSALFFTILFIGLAPWITRNYLVTRKLIVFTDPMYYPCKKSVTASTAFIEAWGGDPSWWVGQCRNAGTYFFPTKTDTTCEFQFPAYAFTPDYTQKDFNTIRGLMLRFQENTANDSLDAAIAGKFNLMRQSVRTKYPFRYYIQAPLLRVKSAFLFSGSYYINAINPGLLLLKLLQTASYGIALVLGGIGMIFFGIKEYKDPLTFVLIGLPLSLIITLCFYLKLNEWRYFIHVYPLLILFMARLVTRLKDLFSNKAVL
jgi:hypothetical protein